MTFTSTLSLNDAKGHIEAAEEQCDDEGDPPRAAYRSQQSGLNRNLHQADMPPAVVDDILGTLEVRNAKTPSNCTVKTHGLPCEFITYCGRSPNFKQGYIVNGNDASEGEFPSFVQLRGPTGGTCGGVIVSDWHVFTAAHCVSRIDPKEYDQRNPQAMHPSLLTVFAGSVMVWPKPDPNRQEFKVAKVCLAKFNRFSVNVHRIRFDVAVLRLATKITFNKYIQPACWPYKFREKPTIAGDNST